MAGRQSAPGSGDPGTGATQGSGPASDPHSGPAASPAESPAPVPQPGPAPGRRARLERWLNARHPLWQRLPVALALAGLTLLATAEPALMRGIWRRVLCRDQFHEAVREVSFYARRSWLRLNLSQDLVFVFCAGQDAPGLLAQRRFLERRRSAHPPGLIAGDLAYVAACLACLLARQGADPSPELARLRAEGDQLLAGGMEGPLPVIAPAPPGFSRAAAADALRDFAEVARAEGQSWFILSGTLLGAVREGDFLAHDHDLDLGVMAGEGDPAALGAALERSGRFLCDGMEHLDIFGPGPDGQIRVTRRPVFMKLRHVSGIPADLFIHYREEGRIWHASDLFCWDNSAFDLAPYPLAGIEAPGPADADRYLTENYGNWRVPVTGFSSATDTPNHRVAGNPLSVAIFLRRIWLLARQDPEAAGRLRRVLLTGGFLSPAPAVVRPAPGSAVTAWRVRTAAFETGGPGHG